MNLLDQTRTILDHARATCGDGTDRAAAQALIDATDRLDEPLRVAVAGRVKAGKSTLVNAMVGELIAPTDARECTRVVTWYRDGVTYRVQGLPDGGEFEPLRFDRDGGSLVIDLGHRLPEQLRCIDVTWPSSRLREMTLVDTPGIDSLTDGVTERAEAFLTGDGDRPTPTDAVLYLLRHVHAGDVRFLEAFHDDQMAAANPVNSIGVLSRADEVGAARPDALRSAERIAGRWRTDRRLTSLVQTVVPVAGLLAEGASTMRQADYDALTTLAHADPALVEDVLVSADRFASSTAPVGVVDSERAALLDRFGLFGCRLAVHLLSIGGARSVSGLADALLDASGMPALRAEITGRFSQRRDVLKARHAILVAQRIAASLGNTDLIGEIERVLDGAHEFAELRVLNALRRGDVTFPDARRRAAEALLGVDGMDLTDRAGVSKDAGIDEVHGALVEQLAVWQRQAEHPLASPDSSAAARALVRTCEGLLGALALPSAG